MKIMTRYSERSDREISRKIYKRIIWERGV